MLGGGYILVLPMNVAALILSLSICVSVAAGGPPKVAVVRVADIFRQLEETVLENRALEAKRDAINQDGRLASYHAMHADLESRRKQLAAGTGEMEVATRAKLEREFAIQHREAASLLEEFESYRLERTREINAEMVQGIKLRLESIQQAAGKIAAEEGFDWVFDASGNSNSGVPLLLYAKSSNDLTNRVLALLGKAQSVEGGDPEVVGAKSAKEPVNKP